MKERIVESSGQLSLLRRLRQATERIHLRLHHHPLIVELLERPSMDTYRTVLYSFLRSYKSFEQRLVNDAQILGFTTLYPQPERTEWLIADLEALNCDLRHHRQIVDVETESELPDVGELVGRLYVVRGSALGGRKILDHLRRRLNISNCCQFLNAGGSELVAHNWCTFQKFCNQPRMRDVARSSAAMSAQSTFHSIEQCLTQRLRQRSPSLDPS